MSRFFRFLFAIAAFAITIALVAPATAQPTTPASVVAVSENGQRAVFQITPETTKGIAPTLTKVKGVHPTQTGVIATAVIQYRDSSYGMSGNVIGKRHLSTTGSAVYRPTLDQWRDILNVLVMTPAGLVECQKVQLWTTQGWYDHGDSTQDVGLIELDCPGNTLEQIGHFGLGDVLQISSGDQLRLGAFMSSVNVQPVDFQITVDEYVASRNRINYPYKPELEYTIGTAGGGLFDTQFKIRGIHAGTDGAPVHGTAVGMQERLIAFFTGITSIEPRAFLPIVRNDPPAPITEGTFYGTLKCVREEEDTNKVIQVLVIGVPNERSECPASHQTWSPPTEQWECSDPEFRYAIPVNPWRDAPEAITWITKLPYSTSTTGSAVAKIVWNTILNPSRSDPQNYRAFCRKQQ
jgi:V8-like Glu-specific endopeptidase